MPERVDQSPAKYELTLGTRGSLLAVAQSRSIADMLMRRHRDIDVRLEFVDTAGDRDLSTPLDAVANPDFFSAEIDRALLDGRVDFTVHSMKDVGAGRPAGITRAAMPLRENPRDVVIFRRDIMERLRRGDEIRIGSSSARRKLNVGAFLNDCLPAVGKTTGPRLRFESIRGAVDHRVARVTTDAADANSLDGVVLALAGLARLWRDPAGRNALQQSLSRVRWMVLPLSECPTAPAQGALALECRSDDTCMRELLGALNDDSTEHLVSRELRALEQTGAAHRSSFGATAIEHALLGPIMYTRGEPMFTPRLAWNRPDVRGPGEIAIPWDGGNLYRNRGRRASRDALEWRGAAPIFVAHWHAATKELLGSRDARIWTSGVRSWRELARRGAWVEGCADNLGFDAIVSTLACDVLQLPPLGEWTAITRTGAEAGWKNTGVGRIVPTYELEDADEKAIGSARDIVGRATDFFWGSIDQYRAVEPWLPARARHACGAGKTADALRQAGVASPLVFPSRREWWSWLA